MPLHHGDVLAMTSGDGAHAVWDGGLPSQATSFVSGNGSSIASASHMPRRAGTAGGQRKHHPAFRR